MPIHILNVLGRLVELEPSQDDLLEQMCSVIRSPLTSCVQQTC